MCNACGCDGKSDQSNKAGHSNVHFESVTLMQPLLKRNDELAARNRARLDAREILAVNLMSSPGSGKTALLEATIDALGGKYRLAVIEGDLETERDAERIRAKAVPAVQIITGSICHLDAQMVHMALEQLPLDSIDILFIENVGNLICPASFDLGQHLNVTLLAATEGDDKPAKYPVMFRAADLVVVTKTDLLPLLEDFSVDRATRCVRGLASVSPVMQLSARKAIGLGPWLDWLSAQRTGVITRNSTRRYRRVGDTAGEHVAIRN